MNLLNNKVIRELLYFSTRINMVIFPKLNYRIQTTLLILFILCFAYTLYDIIPFIQEINNQYTYFGITLIILLILLVYWLKKPHSTDSLFKRFEDF